MKLHDAQHVIRGGTKPGDARAAMILIHGRGATAEDIFSLGEEVVGGLSGVALLAPQASGNTWYPQRFLAPLEQNEPFLSSALDVIGHLVASLGQDGLKPENIVLIGFSQGACLSLEFAARNPCRYGGVVGLSGALIGQPGSARDIRGSLEGTPTYLGCSDRDAHIPLASVEESAEILARMGAAVTKAIFPGMGHTVNSEELSVAQGIIRDLAAGV
ncbi:MAG TPA: dienelactone hydrolase family protein [Opitutaceae bacterium]|jgi:predicted esterase|nr:dienelactone hydrolase family protein [Opitutaceae bacterium]